MAEHVIVALTPHEARLLVLAIDAAMADPRRSSAEIREIESVRVDIMDGLKSLEKRQELTAADGEA